MNRLIVVVLATSVLGTASFLYQSPAVADSKEPPLGDRIKDLMRKTHKGDESPLMRVDRGLKAETPEWAAVRKNTDALVSLQKLLGQQEIIGYRSTKEYVASVQALDKAVDKKDRGAAMAAFLKVKGTCMSCHRNGMP
jgi:hypothetical protein